MISLKKYLDSTIGAPQPPAGPDLLRDQHEPGSSQASCDRTEPRQTGLAQAREARGEKAEPNALPQAIGAYQSALREIGSASLDACPALGQGLKHSLGQIAEKLALDRSAATIEGAELRVREQVGDWGRATAGHYRLKTSEVKELLILMARTAESVGERDQRCAGQISEVTTRLEKIACLEDLTEIRSSIELSAADLKTSLDRMAEEGSQAIAKLKAEVSCYQVKLEEAEELASRDGLTGLRNRAWVEQQIERRVSERAAFSVAIVDIDEFKRVNDKYGHLVGDDVLKKFSTELKTASRSTDVIGRWGGDEFILVLDCPLSEAAPQIERLSAWVCQDYAVKTRTGPMKLNVNASIGLAEFAPGETMKDLLARADAAMYERKPAASALAGGSRR
ncbi:MAG: GGDEF domain-containing protein [Terracidiphilus sp.]|nr:GGDEF domain-containing protein [Terracidiphilus sp.]